MKIKRFMLIVFVIPAGLMILEALKQFVFPGISIWVSAAMTAVLVTIAGTIAAYYVMKRHDELEASLRAEQNRRSRAERRLEEARDTSDEILHDFQKSQERVKLLSGLLPICVTCDKIRDDRGKWESLGRYIEKHPEAAFSRTICDQCLQIIYSEEEQSESDRNL